MTFTDAVLPWVSPIGTILTMVVSVTVFLIVQSRQSRANAEARASQHTENVIRLDYMTGRINKIEDIAEEQTKILINLAEIKGDIGNLSHRIGQIENREAGRRIATAKG